MMCPTLTLLSQSSSISALVEEAGVKGGKKKRRERSRVFAFFSPQPNRVTWRRTTPLKTTVRPLHPLVGAGEAEEGSVRVLLNQQYYRAGYLQRVLFTTYTILFMKILINFPSVLQLCRLYHTWLCRWSFSHWLTTHTPCGMFDATKYECDIANCNLWICNMRQAIITPTSWKSAMLV